MRLALVTLSGLLTLAATLPYLLDIVRGHTKPRLVSWSIWSILVGIASAAAFASHQLPAAVLSACNAVACASVVVLGYKHGDRTLGRLDVVCFVGALLALGLWKVLASAAVAALLAVVTDFLAAVPTFRHAWLRPYEETWEAFALTALGGAFTLLVADFGVLTAIVYPLYLALVDFVITLVLLVSPHRHPPSARPSPTFSSG